MEAGSAHHMLSLPFLLMGRTPHSSPAPAWGPSHRRQSSMNLSNMSPSYRLQFFMNCPSVGPFHRVQSFRNRLLQRGSPTRSQVLPANLLQRGLVFLWGHRSCQDPTPACSAHGVTASSGHPPVLTWGPPRATGGNLLHCGPPCAAEGQPASPWSAPQAAGESALVP